jgi:hypothetical protein
LAGAPFGPFENLKLEEASIPVIGALLSIIKTGLFGQLDPKVHLWRGESNVRIQISEIFEHG